MKNFSNILLATFVALFLLSFGMKSEAVGQCGPGFTPKTIYMNVGGCVYEVNLCIKCSVLGLGASEVKIDNSKGIIKIPTTPPCSSSITYSQVVDYVLSQIKTPDFLFNIACPNLPDAPPCNGPDAPAVYTIHSNLCWKAEVVSYFNEHAISFRPCSDEVCEETFSICIDGNGEYVKTPISNSGHSSTTCTEEGWQIDFPDPPENYPLGTTTPCYIYHTPCNP